MHYAEEEMQYHLQIHNGQVGKYVILPGDPKRCEKIAAYFEHPVLIADSREFVTYTGTLEGETVSVTSTGIGGPLRRLRWKSCSKRVRIRLSASRPAAALKQRYKAAIWSLQPVRYELRDEPGICSDRVSGSRKPGCDLRTARGSPGSGNPIPYGRCAEQGLLLRTARAAGHAGGLHAAAALGRVEKMGCLASEMESAALFIVAQYLRVRCGAVFLTMANQEREVLGLSNPVVHDTDMAVRVGVEALKKLIAQDRMTKL